MARTATTVLPAPDASGDRGASQPLWLADRLQTVMVRLLRRLLTMLGRSPALHIFQIRSSYVAFAANRPIGRATLSREERGPLRGGGRRFSRTPRDGRHCPSLFTSPRRQTRARAGCCRFNESHPTAPAHRASGFTSKARQQVRDGWGERSSTRSCLQSLASVSPLCPSHLQATCSSTSKAILSLASAGSNVSSASSTGMSTEQLLTSATGR